MDTMKIIALTFSLLAFSFIPAQAVADYEYIFKDGSQCENTSHDTNVAALEDMEPQLSDAIQGVQESDWFQQAWLESVGNPELDVHQFDGTVDLILVYKSYPNAGMFVAFKDGCYYGYVVMGLDALNNILYQYVLKSRGT